MTWSRRRFLQSLGLGGMAGMLPMGVRHVSGQNGDSASPKRLLLISHCHGWPYESWRLRPEGFGEASPWSLDLKTLEASEWSQPLRPLFEHRHRLLALDGISLASAELDTDGNRHDKGWVHAWTGGNADFSGVDTRTYAPSLDQLVAAHLSRSDRLSSLEFAVDAGLESGRPLSYNASGSRMPVESNPNRAWTRVFGPSRGGEAQDQRQRRVLGFAHGEYQSLSPSLGARGRDKLETHFELVRQLGARLQGLASLMCEGGAQPPSSIELYDDRFDAFAEIIATAFSCDVTRVATLSLGEMPTSDFGADDITDDVHKGLAHGIYDDPAKHDAMSNYLTLHAHQVSRLVSLLENLPDVGGGSVMDNTLIVWGSELADGWHGYRHYCPVIIGGSWHFETGRYLYWPHETPAELLVPASSALGGYTQFSGLPHQRLLVSVAQAMGVDVDHVGLEHLRGQRGDYIDCRGGLTELRG